MILLQDLHVIGDPCVPFLIILPKMNMCIDYHSSQNSVVRIQNYSPKLKILSIKIHFSPVFAHGNAC